LGYRPAGILSFSDLTYVYSKAAPFLGEPPDLPLFKVSYPTLVCAQLEEGISMLQQKISTPSHLCFLIVLILLINALGASECYSQILDQVHVVPGNAPAQFPDPEIADYGSAKPIKVNVSLVLVPVTVTDPMDRIVTGLNRQDFEILDGKAPQEIKHFSRQDAPVSVGVVLDCSGSMKTKIERAREAVMAFLQTGNPEDEFFLITFADRPEEISNFGDSIEDMQSHLATTIPKGRTALLDAVYLGLTKMRQAKYQKKALLIISDGGDNHSRYSEGELKSLTREADVIIYAVGTYDHHFNTMEEALGPSLLSEISTLTGGRAFTVDNPNDLPAIARRIGVELRDQYLLGYRPPAERRDGRFHKIKVRMRVRKNLPRLTVYSKNGYYAPAE
jgi:Ca-activated chloride channel homolog